MKKYVEVFMFITLKKKYRQYNFTSKIYESQGKHLLKLNEEILTFKVYKNVSQILTY